MNVYRNIILTHIYLLAFVETAGNVSGQPICGKIVQRFPEKDWPDTPFIEGIEWVNFINLSHIIEIMFLNLFCLLLIVLSTSRLEFII